MDASQYKDYVLVLLFVKYVSDKYADQPGAPIEVPPGIRVPLANLKAHRSAQECTMLVLNPKKHSRFYPDECSREVMLKTIEFFENKDKRRLKADDRERVWNADFVEFQKQNQVFYHLLTPAGS